MRVLVTGGAGYIGSHAARALQSRGHSVVIYDNLSSGVASFVSDFEFVRGDIGDKATVSQTLSGIDAVMHFAAHAYVGESVKDPRRYFQNNVQSSLCFLNAVIDAGVKRFIFSSSCAVYGVPFEVPIREETHREPVNPYGVSKLFFEHALQSYCNAYGLNYVSLRYFNAAGADEGGEIGELHDPETHLIPLALRVAEGTKIDLEVFGSDYATPDGTCVRDYIHVSDLAEAHVLALDYLDRGGNSVAVNLGTGAGHSVKEVISTVEKITGKKIPVRVCARREGDPPTLISDAELAHKILNWKATRKLREMVSSAWNWHRSKKFELVSQL